MGSLSYPLTAVFFVFTFLAPATAEELNSLGIRKSCRIVEMAGAKLNNEKKSNERYLYLESPCGLDWVALSKCCDELRSSLKPRGWTSQNGKYHVLASLETINLSAVELKKTDSAETVIKLTVEKLDEHNQAFIKRIELLANRLKDAVRAIDERRDNKVITPTQLTDGELVTLYDAQSKVLPPKLITLLNKMVIDNHIQKRVIEEKKFPAKTSNDRRVLLMKTTTCVGVLKNRYQHPLMTDREYLLYGGDTAWYEKIEKGSDDSVITSLLCWLVKKPGDLEGEWGDALRREWKPLLDAAMRDIK